MTRRSFVVASLVAPLVPVATFVAVQCVLAVVTLDEGYIGAAFAIALFGPAISYPIAWLVAIPLVLLLRRLGIFSMSSTVVLGALVGVGVIVVPAFFGDVMGPLTTPGEVVRIGLAMLAGAASAWVWWRVAEGTATRSAQPAGAGGPTLESSRGPGTAR